MVEIQLSGLMFSGNDSDVQKIGETFSTKKLKNAVQYS